MEYLFPEGTYVRNPIGSKHAPWVDDDGCTIMVKLLQMSKKDHLTQPLYINFDDNQEREPTKYGFELKLYQDKDTGESVQMCWIESCTTFPEL